MLCYKKYNIYDDLKKLAQEIRDEFEEDLKQLLGRRNTLIEYISECKEEINKIEHKTKLKGSCPYLRTKGCKFDTINP